MYDSEKVRLFLSTSFLSLSLYSNEWTAVNSELENKYKKKKKKKEFPYYQFYRPYEHNKR